MRGGLAVLAVTMAAAIAGCTQEARTLSSDAPLTAPVSPSDRRISYFQDNVYQVSQGGRYFSWYGCEACHGPDAKGWLNLADGRWRHGGAFDQVYASIAKGHGGLNYGARVPEQQLWQLTAYARDLPQEPPEKIRRQDLDESGEPTGSSWTGPVR